MQANSDNDKELVKEFLEGSEEAFNLLVKKYQKKIYWFARRMLGNHSDADEITQEVLITLYEKLGSFRFDSSLLTWIYKITNSKTLNLIRKQKVRSYFSLDAIYNKKNEDDIIKNYEEKEKLDRVLESLKIIPPKQRDVFVLRHFEGLSYKEIAKITGKAEGTLKANYFHALKKITELTEND